MIEGYNILGFVEGVSVMWDTSKVAVTGITSDDYYLSFHVKVILITYDVFLCM